MRSGRRRTPSCSVEEEVEISVQVQGKMRARVLVPADADENSAFALAVENENVARHVESKEPRRLVYVPGAPAEHRVLRGVRVAKTWEAVIGLEVHAQLKTSSKLFSSAPNEFGGEPNTRTTEVDIGMPGVLPVINQRAVELAVRVALALDCEIQPISIFARKHYFYPDLPKGYQISQFEHPFATGGAVPIELDGESSAVALTRIHMEEDAAKNIHDDAITAGTTFIDLNRAGVPLVEIVSEPVMKSPEEAGAYLRSLRSILRYLGVSDADMEKGNFRCDANVSVRPSRPAGARNKGRAQEPELLQVRREGARPTRSNVRATCSRTAERWCRRHATGTRPVGESRAQRGKEESDDYRYFPDPDLPPLALAAGWVEALPPRPTRAAA